MSAFRVAVRAFPPFESTIGKQWELFDVKQDPGEKTDVSGEHPEVVKELDRAYDKWWESVQPGMVNENAAAEPKSSPFRELYERQFGPKQKP